MRSFAMAAAATIVCSITGLALADEAETSRKLRACAGDSNSVTRLVCFDGVAQGVVDEADKAATIELKKNAPKVAERNAWSTSIEKSKIDDSSEVHLSVRTTEAIHVRYHDHHPVLWLRCMENRTSAFLHFDEMFMADNGGYGEVTFRIDDQKAFTRRMGESTDHNALGFWSGGSAIPFIKTLYGGKKLLVRATPYSESAITFELDISGTETAVAPLRKACGW